MQRKCFFDEQELPLYCFIEGEAGVKYKSSQLNSER